MPKKKTQKKQKKKPKKEKEQPRFVNVNKNLNVVHINSNLVKGKRRKRKNVSKSNIPFIQQLQLQNQINQLENQKQQQRLDREYTLQPVRLREQTERIRAISEDPTIFYGSMTPLQGLPARLPLKSSPQDIFQTPPSTSRPAPRQLVEEPRRGTRRTRTPARFRGFEVEANLPRR